ncbi:MAG: hypothetical protein EHM59_07970 [Betaproteobacteria bacterium]|nr:MAG: hypothetical protein EHM59_07970 [Betaproteobacteria bacterium]
MRRLIVCLALVLAGCAPTTSVVLLDPTQKYPPTQSVQILLKPPSAPYIEIAKLESKGAIGEPEPAVFEDARERARELGADAIIVVESTQHYEPPVIVYDPWPPYLPWYHDRWHGYRFWDYPAPFPYAYYWPVPHTFPGGNVYTVRSIAIKYRE